MEREVGGDSTVSPLIEAEAARTDSGGRRLVKEEARRQVVLAAPLIAVNLLQYCLQMISLMFVGHYGELALSGASMANSFATITGISVMMGMSGALDTLCGQSYGAKLYKMLGIHMQRAAFILLIVCVPLSILWANAKSILILLGQDQMIAQEAESYIHFLIPYLFSYAIFRSLMTFLSQQNIVFPAALFSGVTTLLHIPVCWLLVFKSGLGHKGAALATSVSGWVNVLLLASYVKFSSSCAKSWKGFSTEALHNVSVFLRLAFPSLVMVCLSIWSSETMVLLSGLLPNPVLETSVFAICIATATSIRMIPYGANGTTCIRVANELGAGRPKIAKLAIKVALFMTLGACILLSTTLWIMRKTWGYAYSNDVQVVRYVATMIPILAFANLLDGLQNVLSGTLTGCGWQKFGAYITLGSYYLIGIPAAFLFGFTLHMGGMGLWLGVICALIVQIASFAFIIVRTDWNQEAKQAMGRVHDSVIPEVQ